MYSAKKLLRDLKTEGWKPGMPFRSTQTFEALSEQCGVDTRGSAIEGAKATMHLGHDYDGFTIRDLFENLVLDRQGDPVSSRFVNDYFDPRSEGLMEAGATMAAVDSTVFAGITGQLMMTKILEPYEDEPYMVRKLLPTFNSPLQKERWMATAPPADPNDDDLVVAEGMEFPMFGFGEQYVETPLTVKRGGIIGLTKEAVFFNRTGDITQKAEYIGDKLAYNEERECINCVIGAPSPNNTPYVEKREIDSGPVTLDLYQQAGAQSGSGQLAYAYSERKYPFVNTVPDTPLTDFHAIRACDQAFSVIVDPNIGRPIVIGKPFVLACHTKRIDIPRVLEAQNVWQISQQGVNTVGALVTNSPNPVRSVGMTADSFLVSRLLQQVLVASFGYSAAQAQETWFYGDISGAFEYVTNWPVTVVQAPVNSEAEFNNDIIIRWKASKRGRVAIREPRKILRCNCPADGTQSLSGQ